MSKRFITVVLGVPSRSDGRVLLSQRHAPESPQVHHKWQLIGGGVEFGEHAEEALVREFQEETMLQAEILFPYPIVKTSVWTSSQLNSEYSTHATLLTYIIRLNDDKPNWINDPETADARWFTLEEISQLDALPHTLEIVIEALSLVDHLKAQQHEQSLAQGEQTPSG